jgi:hypothetical protein
VGSRAAAKSRDRGEFFAFLLAVDNAVTCKPKKHNKQAGFSFVFKSASPPSPFSDLLRFLSLQICQIWSLALHAPPTGQACGWLDRQLPSSSFISTPAVSSTAAMVGRSAPLKSRFSAPFYCPSASLLIIPVMSCWRRDAAVGRLMVVSGGDAEAEISWLTMRAALLLVMVKTD